MTEQGEDFREANSKNRLAKESTDADPHLFLCRSSHYSLENALETMNKAVAKSNGKRTFAQERVFVLRRMGDLVSAINILLEEVRDIPAAIEFAEEQDDPELWFVSSPSSRKY